MYEKAKKENEMEEKMLEREISLKGELSSRLRYSLMKHFSSSENLKQLGVGALLFFGGERAFFNFTLQISRGFPEPISQADVNRAGRPAPDGARRARSNAVPAGKSGRHPSIRRAVADL